MTQPNLNQKLALEMAMQDVMDNMEEFALEFGLAGDDAPFEILAIEPTAVPDAAAPTRGAALRSPFNAHIQPLNRSRHVA